MEDEKETLFKRERIIFEEGNMEAGFYSRKKVSVGPVSFLLCQALHTQVCNDIMRITVHIWNKCRQFYYAMNRGSKKGDRKETENISDRTVEWFVIL